MPDQQRAYNIGDDGEPDSRGDLDGAGDHVGAFGVLTDDPGQHVALSERRRRGPGRRVAEPRRQALRTSQILHLPPCLDPGDAPIRTKR